MIAVLRAESTAVDILRRIGMESVVTFNSHSPVAGCVEKIAEMISKVVRGNYSGRGVNWDIFNDYSAEALTKRLAEAFDLVVGNNRD